MARDDYQRNGQRPRLEHLDGPPHAESRYVEIAEDDVWRGSVERRGKAILAIDMFDRARDPRSPQRGADELRIIGGVLDQEHAHRSRAAGITHRGIPSLADVRLGHHRRSPPCSAHYQPSGMRDPTHW